MHIQIFHKCINICTLIIYYNALLEHIKPSNTLHVFVHYFPLITSRNQRLAKIQKVLSSQHKQTRNLLPPPPRTKKSVSQIQPPLNFGNFTNFMPGITMIVRIPDTMTFLMTCVSIVFIPGNEITFLGVHECQLSISGHSIASRRNRALHGTSSLG